MQKPCFSRQSANNAKVIGSKENFDDRESFRQTERLLLTNEQWKVEQGLIEESSHNRRLHGCGKSNPIARADFCLTFRIPLHCNFKQERL